MKFVCTNHVSTIEIEIEGPALVRVSVANISKPNLPDRHSGENRNASESSNNVYLRSFYF